LAFSAIQGPVTGSSCQSILIVHRQPALLLTDTIFCAQNLYFMRGVASSSSSQRITPKILAE
jgi:hypothetical protein